MKRVGGGYILRKAPTAPLPASSSQQIRTARRNNRNTATPARPVTRTSQQEAKEKNLERLLKDTTAKFQQAAEEVRQLKRRNEDLSSALVNTTKNYDDAMKYIGSAHSTIKDLQLRLDANVLRNLKNEIKMNEATQANKEESEKVEQLMRELEEAKNDMAQIRRRVEANKTCLGNACNLDNGEGEMDTKYDLDPTKSMMMTPMKEFRTCAVKEDHKEYQSDEESASPKPLGSRSAIKECKYSMDYDESEPKTEETVNTDKHTFESLEIGVKDTAESVKEKKTKNIVSMENCIYSPDYDYDEAETRDKAGSKHHTFDVLECGAKECTTCVEEEESKYLILDEESFLTELLELSIPMDTRIYRPDLDVSEAVANDQLYSNKYMLDVSISRMNELRMRVKEDELKAFELEEVLMMSELLISSDVFENTIGTLRSQKNRWK
ncbi:unnamed protein product [Albugo candida]|nr:unnamed protein product [Albugo candida]|eukprot:CCI44381.1 unnamed protein product [Albugo candida]